MNLNDFTAALSSDLINRGIPENTVRSRVSKLILSLSSDDLAEIDSFKSPEDIADIANALASMLAQTVEIPAIRIKAEDDEINPEEIVSKKDIQTDTIKIDDVKIAPSKAGGEQFDTEKKALEAVQKTEDEDAEDFSQYAPSNDMLADFGEEKISAKRSNLLKLFKTPASAVKRKKNRRESMLFRRSGKRLKDGRSS